MPKVEIVETKSGKVAHTFETNHAIDSTPYEQFLAGLYRKVDFDRFWIRESALPGEEKS